MLGTEIAPPPAAPAGTPDRLPPTRPGVSGIEWAALGVALAPIVAVVVWAIVVRWVPLSDSGQIVIRSRDVLTDHHPLIGHWSSGSGGVDGQLNNLGSLNQILIAPFTRLDPYWGAAVGLGAWNAAFVIVVWATARALRPSTGALTAMAGTVALEASMGAIALLQARQQFALIMPFWCLLWLCVALWAGRLWALPATVVVASIILQTHLSYAYPTVAVVAVSTVALARATHGHWFERRTVRTVALAALVGLVCWAQPIWDQLFGIGNLSGVLFRDDIREGGGGLQSAVSMTSHVLLPPFWLPGSMGEFAVRLVTPGTPASASEWLALAAWAVILGATAWTVRRRAHDVAMVAVASTALIGGFYAAIKLPPSFGGILAPQNYYWMWPIAILATTAIGLAVAPLVPRGGWSRRRVAPVALVAMAILAGTMVWSDAGMPIESREAFAERPVAQELLRELGDSLDRLDVDGPIVIDFSRGSSLSPHRYTFLGELQRRGIEFTFDRGTGVDLRRFGRDRCEDGSAPWRLHLETGFGIEQRRPGDLEVAAARSSGSARAEMADEAELVGRALEAGVVQIPDAVRDGAPEAIREDLRRVLIAAEDPSRGLVQYLRGLRDLGLVAVPADVSRSLERWERARRRVEAEVALTLAPNRGRSDGRC
ncbi:hypothetical protein HC251_24370 [Iamia sp. SCSIO 61187]|uniref:hypothetical protein n=1 Tax=Iamia sp. SCSIO 61187 TaxID=2722752 RepID=UPI001C625E91|nr:hypothetical protein [Iamia sp. SCSIO 61187]QYG95256.1 hypothetical protein HC251_24370 [Iamia sp. SCSIO 61187]